MKMNDRYEIRVVVIEIKSNGTSGNIYDNYKTFKMEKPYSGYIFGYVVFDTETGRVPDECNDWNDDVIGAVLDCYDHVVGENFGNDCYLDEIYEEVEDYVNNQKNLLEDRAKQLVDYYYNTDDIGNKDFATLDLALNLLKELSTRRD